MENVKLNRGFTIVETLVGTFIFVVVLLGLLNGLMVAKMVDTRNLLIVEAKTVAQECLESLRGKMLDLNLELDCNVSQVINVSVPCTNNAGANLYKVAIRDSKHTFKIIWDLIPVDESIGLYQVDVLVCWDFIGKQYLYRLKSVIEY
ncbi:hypothetical protein [Hydrogenivirga sp. 128-5-R1-1]|uniref:hypothetical protein n=1 Tax=Hydrogenivirga sp. 128-5-R1-1 TaxID=392423 RepID=UPI00015F3098|nr:hypothetical protein [Hydrogenivirga sp. 128-5-R1-1]EDP74485.1 hypothetical protein HG1285_09961 [Hydrogenivirga sp. 128-5-R1-1]